jgi:hypothetical protein
MPSILKASQSLAGRDKEKLKIEWSLPEGWSLPGGSRTCQYLLLNKDLDACIQACREALDSLQKAADSASEQRALADALQQLADSGRALYTVLMSGAGGQADQAAAFREWFEQNVATSLVGTWRVEFRHKGADQKVIPWGLTYPSITAAGGGGGTNYDDYVDFWAHRYSTASYLLSADSNIGRDIEIDGKAILCSLLIEVSSDVVDLNVSAQDSENLRMRLWGPLQEHTILFVRDLRDRFRGKKEFNHIVYLNLKTNGTNHNYAFPDESLTPDTLKRITAHLVPIAKHAIAMIDREAIIRGDRGPEWLYTFFNDRWAGLIAAETDIKAKKLQHEGFRFLTELLDCGVKLSESLPEIRKRLWPYSLLYGVYSNPENIFVKPPPDIVKEMRAVLERREQGGAM